MKLTEILTESELQDIQHLEEGPLLNKVGAAVGDVAGGVAGMGRAFKKGFASGKARVAGDADPYPGAADAEQPAGAQQAPAAGGNAPAAQGGAAGGSMGGSAPAGGAAGGSMGGSAQPSTTNVNVSGGNAQGGAGGNAPAGGAAGQTPPANPAAEKAGQTLYAQVKSQVGQLDKKGKQRILALLNKSLGTPDPKPAAGAQTPPAADAAQTAPAQTAPAADAAQTAPAQTAPAADTTPAATPGAEPTTKPKRTRNKKTAAAPAPQASQAEIDADRERNIGKFTDSKIRVGNNLSEKLASKIHISKQRMVSEGVRNGTFSIFRKY